MERGEQHYRNSGSRGLSVCGIRVVWTVVTQELVQRWMPPAGYLAVLLKLVVPFLEVLVRDFPGHIKHHDAGVGLVVVGGVHAVEPLLPSSVPEIHGDFSSVIRSLVVVSGIGKKDSRHRLPLALGLPSKEWGERVGIVP